MTGAVVIDDVAKRFRLEHDRAATVKGAVLRGWRRGPVEEFWALDGISFEVPAGSTFALIGHNGSGKSTLLKCIARILRPDRGTITIDGRMSALLELGAGFHPELTGRENVYLNASILGLPAAQVRQRFDEIVGFAGLERFIDEPVRNYSSGMYVRLGFSVAINVDPDVLLVDEVLAVGDEEFQQRCLARFADLRARGRTVVVVSHSMGMVRSLCDAGAWLHQGRLRKLGTAEEVVDAYLDAVRHGDGEGVDRSDGGARAGMPDGPIRAVTVRSPAGEPLREIRPGDGATVVVGVDRSRLRHDGPVALALDVRRRDGILVARELLPLGDEPRGELAYEVDAVRLVPADYIIAASLVDADTHKLVSASDTVTPLRITTSPGAQRFGVVHLGGRGTWHPG